MTISVSGVAVPSRYGRTLWLRSAYAVAALPAAIASLTGAPVQASLARRLLDVEPEHAGRFSTILAALLSLPLNALSLVLAGYGWAIVVLNLLYPGRWLIGMGGSLDDAWGGPTLAGAWAVHASGGLVMLLLMPVILKYATALQERLMLRVLGGTMDR
ncbi:hypothetical protein [Actinomadura sp. 7K507]|uniref:hypothetical protein n=1 Tax=Actinomadura sp. 7K507 TaxID=2530365 RepID=UPI00104C947B|nr:hypothetical protein [Actinomadura sp. 7K507]TDC84608.1 hypothetical protein E1285_26510 [Actinomadura sp. 7K507]